MMKAWEKNIRKVVPYVPGEQPNKERMIKLNTNENVPAWWMRLQSRKV